MKWRSWGGGGLYLQKTAGAWLPELLHSHILGSIFDLLSAFSELCCADGFATSLEQHMVSISGTIIHLVNGQTDICIPIRIK